MAAWPLDGSRPVSAQARELLNSWNAFEDEAPAEQAHEHALSAQSAGVLRLSEILNKKNSAPQPDSLPSLQLEADETMLTDSTEPVLDARDRGESRAAYARYSPVKDTSISPLTRVNQILEENSDSSRWLNQRGYLEPFKSPACVLDLNISTIDKELRDGNDVRSEKLLRVGAVLTAPDGSKRTVIACDDGTSSQQITGPGGQKIVMFMSSGQIVEFGKDAKRTLDRPRLRTGELSIFK